MSGKRPTKPSSVQAEEAAREASIRAIGTDSEWKMHLLVAAAEFVESGGIGQSIEPSVAPDIATAAHNSSDKSVKTPEPQVTDEEEIEDLYNATPRTSPRATAKRKRSPSPQLRTRGVPRTEDECVERRTGVPQPAQPAIPAEHPNPVQPEIRCIIDTTRHSPSPIPGVPEDLEVDVEMPDVRDPTQSSPAIGPTQPLPAINPTDSSQALPEEITRPVNPQQTRHDPDAATERATKSRKSNCTTTKKAHGKAEEILAGGGGVAHRNGQCTTCRRGNHQCLINPAISGGNTCARCAKHKEKCSHQVVADGHFVREHGRQVRPRPCNQCRDKIGRGLPAECYQAGEAERRKLGTACSQCMIDGTRESCSVNERPRMRAGKFRD